ncbi:hypothetical protein B9Z55_017880 [Caenorhabditis nigoni]|uniref:SCP domain-containing protein n=1 Tax=Caenorhabditis nigoni TaxID=1611254 RepID=A0A2G5TC29_9PELO|nr:hypothetical protein B9Z55_017880 [Caenorhabditis nigoni]
MKSALLFLAIVGCVTAQSLFSSTGQTGIVNVHNVLRSKIAKGTYNAAGTIEPAAANMRKMIWDASLATSAQNYVNGCPDDHSGTSGVGENMYWSWSSQAPPSNLDSFGVSASNSWEKEFQDYGWTSIVLDMATFNTGIGHATQMAWANTNLVGCGVKNCGKDSTMGNMYKVEVVCQYKSQGNILNTNIYQKGNSCSACASGSTCEVSSGLCA